MIVLRKLKTLVSMPVGDAAMLVEALVVLVLAKLVISVVPFRVYARWLDGQRDGHDVPSAIVERVRWAVISAARNAPFASKCLPQAMAAKAMLARRRHGSVLHLGVKVLDGQVAAHAWLTVGGVAVVGGKDGRGFGEVASFGSKG